MRRGASSCTQGLQGASQHLPVPTTTGYNSLWVELNASAEVCHCCVVVFGSKGFVAQLLFTRSLNLAAAEAAAASQAVDQCCKRP
jgi:hypothetical protein